MAVTDMTKPTWPDVKLRLLRMMTRLSFWKFPVSKLNNAASTSG